MVDGGRFPDLIDFGRFPIRNIMVDFQMMVSMSDSIGF